jgi:hypothetical protein
VYERTNRYWTVLFKSNKISGSVSARLDCFGVQTSPSLISFAGESSCELRFTPVLETTTEFTADSCEPPTSTPLTTLRSRPLIATQKEERLRASSPTTLATSTSTGLPSIANKLTRHCHFFTPANYGEHTTPRPLPTE